MLFCIAKDFINNTKVFIFDSLVQFQTQAKQCQIKSWQAHIISSLQKNGFSISICLCRGSKKKNINIVSVYGASKHKVSKCEFDHNEVELETSRCSGVARNKQSKSQTTLQKAIPDIL